MQSGELLFDGIDRVILPVSNAKQAADWYVREFEFRVARIGGQEIDLRVNEGETLLTLAESEDHFQPLLHLDEGGHVPCFNFYTHWEDLHGSWLQSRGIRITDTMATPHMNVCEMTDPDGNVIGICHEKANSLFYTPNPGPLPPMFHRILAVFLPVKDLESSIRWYCEALGFKLHNHWGQGADLSIGEGETVATMICMEEEMHRQAVRQMNGRAYYSLRSSNIDEAYRQLSKRGATADECRKRDGINAFHVRTPEGLMIRITEKELMKVE